MKSKFLFIFMLLILVLGIASVSAADIMDSNPDVSSPCDVATDGFGYASNDGVVANDSVNSPLLGGG